jgi:ubiquinone/menaquinone biosynthesis C-methylase UbiE
MFRRRRTEPAPGPSRRSDWRSFDTVAETYDRVRTPIHAPAARDLTAALGPPAEGGLLDVGTGTGVMALAARDAGWTPTVGIDRSVPMLELARKRGAGLLVGADAIDLPFRDGNFGAVAASFVLHAFPKYDTALFDMVRVLRPGGVMATATWDWRDDEFTKAWKAVAESFATKELLGDGLRQAAPWAERFAVPDNLDEALRTAGLRNVRVLRHQYRSQVSIEDYLAGREIGAMGRYLRGVLTEQLWDRFRKRVDEEFRSRFRDPLGDTNEVLIAVGTKS